MQIIPTTGLKQNFLDAEKWIKEIKEDSRWIQVDVCDNFFKPGKTFELELLEKMEVETDNVLWDIHLMVKEPTSWVNKCVEVGATRIIGQVEMMKDRSSFLEAVKSKVPEAGLAFDVETPIDQIEGDWDIILLMGRQAGFGYFPFDPKVLEKIKQVKEMGYRVGVDGGADIDNYQEMFKAGADIIYSEINYWKILNDFKNQQEN